MATMILRFSNDKHERLAENQGASLKKLMDELATIALANHDTETKFRSLA